MTINIQHIEALNNKAKQLNQMRQQKIGLQQAAEQNYDRLVKAYDAKYGIRVDDTNIQSEYDTVQQNVQQQYNELSKHIADIENGVYNTVPEVDGLIQKEITVGQAQQVAQTQFTQTQPNFNSSTNMTTGHHIPAQHLGGIQPSPTNVVQSEPRQVDPTLSAQASLNAMNQQTAPPQFGVPQPTAPTTHVPFGVPQPIAPTTPATIMQQGDVDPADQPIQPQGWDLNSEFAGINSGKPFGQ